MSTLAEWARWQPGQPLPVGPVTDIVTQSSVGGTTVPFSSPGVTSEQLRAVVEAPGYMEPTVPFLNTLYDPTGGMVPVFTAPPGVYVPPYVPPAPPVYAQPVPPTTWFEPEIPQPEPPRTWWDLPPLEPPRTWTDLPPLPPPEEQMLPPTQLFVSSPANILGTTLYNTSLGGPSQQYSLTGGQVAGAIGAAGTFCNSLPNVAARYACQLAAAAAAAVANSTGAPNGSGSMQNGGGGMMLASGAPDCLPGYVRPPGSTVCVNPMAMLPGGAPFTMQASGGYFGALSAPATMRSQTILRCPRGLILGKDNRCYAKGSIPRQHRKWLPEPRPLVSRSDVKALARIKSIRSRVKKAASSAGLSTTTKGRGSCAPKRKK